RDPGPEESLLKQAGDLLRTEYDDADVRNAAEVKTHVNRAMAKVAARDRAQLVVIAYESGLVRPRVE
ncbi:DNA-binding response regulator, partial [Streptomyces halstedii]